MDWQFDNSMPIYTQLVYKIELAIVSGEFVRGQRLSAVRDRAAEAGVNPNTMQRALAAMEEEGLLTSQRNTGRYVTQDTDQIAATRNRLAERELAFFQKKMKQLGYSGQEITQLLMKGEPNNE